MASKGYCVNTDVSGFLGLTFTTGQLTFATSKIETAENWIDNYTHRGWLMGTQTDERHDREDYLNGELYLRYPTITTLTTLTGRTWLGDTPDTTLVAGTDYELADAETGLVILPYPRTYQRLLATYTPGTTVPTVIRDAAAELIAWWMQPSLRPDTYGLLSVGLPDLNMRFAFHDVDAVPPGVLSKLDQYRYRTAA